MRKFGRLGVAVALLAMAVTVLPGGPASANHDVCVANGGVVTDVDLYYPVTVEGTTVHTPPSRSVPPGTGFSLALVGVCTGSGSINFGGGQFTNRLRVNPLVDEAGPVGNYCGHSTGRVTLSGSTGDWVSAGSMLVITGGVAGIVNAVPDVTNTCAAGARRFIVTGAVCIHVCDEP